MGTPNVSGHEPPTDSVMTVFRFRAPAEPLAIVIGPSHAPYYLYDDGRTEVVAPEPAGVQFGEN